MLYRVYVPLCNGLGAGECLIGMKGKHHSAATRRKISEAQKGRTFSKEHRKKLSEAALKRKRQPMTGHVFTEESKRKMSEAQRRRYSKAREE